MRISSLAKSALLRPVALLVCGSMLCTASFPAMLQVTDSLKALVI